MQETRCQRSRLQDCAAPQGWSPPDPILPWQTRLHSTSRLGEIPAQATLATPWAGSHVPLEGSKAFLSLFGPQTSPPFESVP